MQGSSAKNKIIQKIQQALKTSVPAPFEHQDGSKIFAPSANEPAIEFAENFVKLQGRFSFCLDAVELVKQLNELVTIRKWKNIFCNNINVQNLLLNQDFSFGFTDDLAGCDVAITECEYLVANTGGIVLSSALPGGRSASIYSPVHVCIAGTDQLVLNVEEAINKMLKKYKNNFPSLVSFATGPSRTADIEKTLVTGVHGPKEVFCFLLQL